MIRREQAGDAPQIAGLLAEAFAGEPLAEVLADLRRDGDFVAGFVAAGPADEVQGYVAFSRALLDTRAALLPVLLLGPLVVASPLRRKGIGTALVEGALAALPEGAVFLEGDPANYRRLGWVAAGPLGYRTPSLRIPGPAFQVRLRGPAPDPGTLVYPRAFWTHDVVGLRDPDLAAFEATLGG